MLYVTIPQVEQWDEQKQEFLKTKTQTIALEHSLVSLSKWEAKWKKPFIGKEEKTTAEILDYIRCMTITQNVSIDVYSALTTEALADINDYIEHPMTATWFSEEKNRNFKNETITAEVIYYWMIAYNIPFECQKWHLNRLLTLIKVCSVKNAPSKKRNKKEIQQQNKQLNAQRRQALQTRG